MVKKAWSLGKIDGPLIAVQALTFIYVLVDPPLSPDIAAFGRSPAGLGLIGVLALSAFSALGPVTGVLVLFAGYVFLRRATQTTSRQPVQTVSRSEIEAAIGTSSSDEETLEEKMVSQMAPARSLMATSKASYVPVLAKQKGIGTPLSA